jgi:5'-3' exonuclease
MRGSGGLGEREAKQRVVVLMYLGIDATNWIHQLWHAHAGQGVLDAARRRLDALVAEWPASAVVACFDRRSFRHDLDATYKATRGKRDPGLCEVLAQAPEAFSHVATIAAEDGYEADDCLATLGSIGFLRGEKTVLASPDKDLRQCLRDKQVAILRGFKTDRGRVLSPDWFMAADLRDVYGLRPEQWPDYQALVGDSGDNVKGCPGWGEKTAAAVLGKVGTLAACLANPWGVPGISAKQRESLFQFKERAGTVLKLVTLRTDCGAVFDAMR